MSNLSLYIIVVLIWGSTWMAIELQLGVVPPEMSVFYRYVSATLILFAWSAIRGLPLRFDISSHVKFIFLGLLLFCLNYILAYHAQRFVTSALIAIVFSMMLWMNILNTRIFFKVRAEKRVLFGAFLGMIGITLMFWPSIDALSMTDVTIIGAALGIAGTYSASLGNMVSQAAQRRSLPILQTNAWGMLYGSVFTGMVLIASGESLIFDPSLKYALSLLYLIVFGSIIGFGAYLQLLGRIGAHKAGYATVMFPAVALVLSTTFEGMVLDMLTICGLLVALTGNLFVMKTSPRTTQ